MGNSIVKDPSLVDKGKLKIEWVENFMPILKEIRSAFEKEKPFKNKTIAAILHLEAKTAALLRVLADAGATVATTSANPETTDDSVAAALAEHPNIHVYSWRGETVEEYWENINRVLDHKPDIIIDDGADGMVLVHQERTELLDGIIGGCEETTTGVTRIKNLERERKLKFPVIAVNDAKMKHLFDNRFGTAESSIFGILNATNLMIAGKTVVVAGFGWCGRGLASRLKGMGAKVIVCEVDPIKALEACMEGYQVMKMIDAVKQADIVITVTGVNKVVRKEHFEVAKDKCIFCNAGHFDVEVCIPDLEKLAVKKKKTRYFGLPYNDYLVEEYELKDGRKLYLLAKGRLVNIVAGQGHPAEVMDFSFSLQALSAKYVLENHSKLDPRVYKVPDEIDKRVAELKLKSMGIEIDRLTPEQEEYIKSYKLGT
ncbi:MAG: adenosylhomocysteinase [Candidatus Odinarchaeota archaeon]|nr:adenosylhomocysteinase [Candidatus Odinarchaeota archaeon]